ncbi:glycoside hydrolase family 16 protein [Algibacter luteus]|uniref:Glycosyl hydrolases family 16 n=1 Tax=Algibacter luteus TaxID=1178825 RepID=A0A1M6F9Y1_9FLAO|nr:glycoside hydrolase family 16 protein [Algibacter luteus]SHI94480.1 Glycosyl hydrolases family 16 [Algibacter luteus]
MTNELKTYTLFIIGFIFLSYLIFAFFKETPDTSKENIVTSLNPKFDVLVWSDEFDVEGTINQEKWFHQTKLPPSGSWWGGLIQHYTNRDTNSYVKDGYLHLVAKKESFEAHGEVKEYTAARLNSKFAFTYGRVEIRAKLPAGIGTWPAIWMLNKNIDEDGAYWDNQGFGTTKWPFCGEIDILEHWGKNQDYVSSAVHNGSGYGSDVKNIGGQNIKGASTKFHNYVLEWSKDKMIFSIDGVEHYKYQPTIKNSDTWPYDSDYYIILNIAIEPDIDPNFVESPMVVDYIRVYQ